MQIYTVLRDCSHKPCRSGDIPWATVAKIRASEKSVSSFLGSNSNLWCSPGGGSLLTFPESSFITSKCVADLKPVPPGTEGMFMFAVCSVPWV